MATIITILFECSLSLSLSTLVLTEEFKSSDTRDVCFSPSGGDTEAIVTEISSAKSKILIQAYSFNTKDYLELLFSGSISI